MTLSPKRQHGLTLISTIFILASIAAVVLVLVKVVPVYLEHNKVAGALKSLESTPAIESKSEYEIRDSLSKLFDLNYVYSVNQDDIKISKHGSHLKVAIKYEVIKKLVGNLSLLAEFDDVIEVGQK